LPRLPSSPLDNPAPGQLEQIWIECNHELQRDAQTSMQFLQSYFSFRGRLSRGLYFIRGMQLSIFAVVPFVASIMLFKSGDLFWLVGVAFVGVAIAMMVIGQVSLIVRRLHDLGFSGYHAIWIGAAQFAWIFLPEAPADVAWLASPLLVIFLLLLFYPGNRGANRFGVE
jgi:uncharacterized membrane protein YhaH (DUF805 family)